MIYLDTSVLVAALIDENKTAQAQTWLANQPEGELAISEWVVTEFSSALSLKVRTGQINENHRAIVLATFTRLSTDSLHVLSLSGYHCRTAAHFADRHELGLRAGDALHLAVAVEHGATIVTLDRTMADAASALGIGALLL